MIAYFEQISFLPAYPRNSYVDGRAEPYKDFDDFASTFRSIIDKNDALWCLREDIVLKKLSRDMRERFKRISRKIERSWAKELRHRQRQRRQRAKVSFLGKPRKKKSVLPEQIFAPRLFSIESDQTREPVMRFLAELRKAFIRDGVRAITINFTQTVQFVATATILFYAELSRLIEMTEKRIRVRYRPPINDKASQVLRQIGIDRMCGQPLTLKKSFRFYDDVVHWRVAHGYTVNNSICAPAIEEFEGQLALPLINGLFKGLGEAMTNAKHHAYLEIRADGLRYNPPYQDWWMFSQARENYLSVVFCDLGIGIPNTLPLKRANLWQKIRALGRANSDGACIEDAIEDSRTRTRRPERGKGLGNIVEVVSGLKGGMVTVLSNRGSYSSTNGTVKACDFKDSILGTVICWRVPLSGEIRHGK
jgi:hypothetical protein